MKRAAAVLMAVFMAVIMSAICVSAEENAEPSLSKSSLTIVNGVNYRLKVKNVPAGTVIKWSSSDRDVAVVSVKGKVITKSCGSTVISAKVGKVTLKCRVRVIPATIKFEQKSFTVPASGKSVIKAVVKGSKSVGMKNSNTKVAAVKMKAWQGDELPLEITPVSKGTVTVTLFNPDDSSISSSVRITVKDGAASAELAEDETLGEDLSEMSSAEQILYYVNIEREKAGVKPLELNDTLCETAEIRAKEVSGKFSHERPDGTEFHEMLKDTEYEKRDLGENIAAGYDNAEDTVAQWMASKRHRENMLNEGYNYLGAAHYYKSKSAYHDYWVQIFSE